MWLWWVISLLILVSCIIFAWRMIASSYEFLPVDKKFFVKFNKKRTDHFLEHSRSEFYPSLNHTTKNPEDSNAFYQIQFAKFNERLRALEDRVALQPASSVTRSGAASDEEDWKELYYEENEAKAKLENELDNLHQQMEQLQASLKENEIEDWKEMYYAENELKLKLENELDIIKLNYAEAQAALDTSSEMVAELSLLKSEYENSRNNIQGLKKTMNLLQKRLSASAERENELENLLISEIIVREKYAMLQSKYSRLQIEANDLEQRIMEQSQREMNLEVRLMRLNELESKLAICEEEKLKLKAQLGNRVN